MKAAVLLGEKKIQVQEREIPKLGPNEMLMKVKVVGICGSDISYYQRGLADVPPPIVLGHEFTGDIVEVGEIPKKLGLIEEGTRVVAEPMQTCGVCSACKKASPNLCNKPIVLGVTVDGGFSEYCKVLYNYVHPLPDTISYEEGAFTEPLACALYGVKKMRVSPGDVCAVIGPGPIGLMMLQYVKASGAYKVALIGTRDYRLEMGKKLGADFLINTKDKNSQYFTDDPVGKVKELSGEGADAVIVATGNIAANELGINIGGSKSRIVFFGGAGYDPNAYAKINLWQGTLRDMEILFSWLGPYMFPEALRAISTGQVKVKPLITHTFPLEKTGEAIETVEQRIDKAMKVQIKP